MRRVIFALFSVLALATTLFSGAAPASALTAYSINTNLFAHCQWYFSGSGPVMRNGNAFTVDNGTTSYFQMSSSGCSVYTFTPSVRVGTASKNLTRNVWQGFANQPNNTTLAFTCYEGSTVVATGSITTTTIA